MGVKKEKDQQENRARGWEQFQQALNKGIVWSVCGRRLHWGYKVFCVVIQQWVLELYRHEKTQQKHRSWDVFQHIGFMKGGRMWPCVEKSSKQEKANRKLIARENTAEEEEIVCPLGEVESQCRTDLGKSPAGRNRGREGKGGKDLLYKSKSGISKLLSKEIIEPYLVGKNNLKHEKQADTSLARENKWCLWEAQQCHTENSAKTQGRGISTRTKGASCLPLESSNRKAYVFLPFRSLWTLAIAKGPLLKIWQYKTHRQLGRTEGRERSCYCHFGRAVVSLKRAVVSLRKWALSVLGVGGGEQ